MLLSTTISESNFKFNSFLKVQTWNYLKEVSAMLEPEPDITTNLIPVSRLIMMQTAHYSSKDKSNTTSTVVS